MPDSTRRSRSFRPFPIVALGWACALLAVMAAAPPRALADGDPASDVLASQMVFVPGDGGFAAAQVSQLNGLLVAAHRAGIPIRAALIATQADLGSVGELWGRPQSYAQFLGQELSQVYRGTVLVVMPNGFGTYRPPPGTTLAVAGPMRPLVAAGIRAVEALAAATGHRLRPPPAVAAPGSPSALGSVDLGSWLALAVGAALIAAAWTASLRARPAGRLRRAR